MEKTLLSLSLLKATCIAAILALFCLVSLQQKALAIGTPQLEATDCVKCHKKEPAEIAANGGKHQTEITCLDCHVEHLPDGTDLIPLCSRCHGDSDSPHFQLPNCLGCHTNPHMPIASLVLPDTAKSECGLSTKTRANMPKSLVLSAITSTASSPTAPNVTSRTWKVRK